MLFVAWGWGRPDSVYLSLFLSNCSKVSRVSFSLGLPWIGIGREEDKSTLRIMGYDLCSSLSPSQFHTRNFAFSFTSIRFLQVDLVDTFFSVPKN